MVKQFKTVEDIKHLLGIEEDVWNDQNTEDINKLLIVVGKVVVKYNQMGSALDIAFADDYKQGRSPEGIELEIVKMDMWDDIVVFMNLESQVFDGSL